MAGVLRSALLAVPHGFSEAGGQAEVAILPGASVVRLRQTHSAAAVVIGDNLPAPETEGDALVTTRRGIVLAIVTADCAPVLLADPAAGVVAAVHAGWRGAHGGVIEVAVDAMTSLGAERAAIQAAIGPTIAQASYEVDAAFRDVIGDEAAAFLAPGRPGHAQFDLPGYVAMRLRKAGVGVIDDLALDTYEGIGRFHSYRRATHRGEATGERQTSAIALP